MSNEDKQTIAQLVGDMITKNNVVLLDAIDDKFASNNRMLLEAIDKTLDAKLVENNNMIIEALSTIEIKNRVTTIEHALNNTVLPKLKTL